VQASASSDASGLRIRLAPGTGRANVATGLPLLDHLLALLAAWGRLDLDLETAPVRATEREVDEVGRALGRAVAALVASGGYGSAVAPHDEALAHVVIEVSGRPLVVTNVDLSAAQFGGLGRDLLARLLDALARESGLTLHVRLLEGEEADHVLEAIFKALGLALAQACDGTVQGG